MKKKDKYKKDFHFTFDEASESLDISKKRLKQLLVESEIFYKENKELLPYPQYLKSNIVVKHETKKGKISYKIARLFIWQELANLKNQYTDIADWRESVKVILGYEKKALEVLGKIKYTAKLNEIGFDGLDGLIKANLILIRDCIELFNKKEQEILEKHYLIITENKLPYPYNI